MKYFNKITLMIFFLIILSSFFCGSYKVYFNTYYNAQTLYNSGIKGNEEEADKDKSLVSSPSLEAAVAKFSKILEIYPDSKYVDDALLHLGKIFYFQEKYLDAEVKFLEIMSNFPDSELIPAAHYWMAKTYSKQNKFRESSEEYAKVIELNDDKLKNHALLGSANLFFIQDDYLKAIEQYKSIIQRVKDERTRAESQFQIGECYLLLGDFENAGNEYLKVKNYKTEHYYFFISQFGYARSLKLSNKFDESLKILNELLSDGKNKEYFATIELEIANCLELKKEYDKAITAYNNLIIYYKDGEEVAESYYNLGKIYLNVYSKLDTSLSFFKNSQKKTKNPDLRDSLNKRITVIENIKKQKTEIQKWYRQRLTYLEQARAEQDTTSDKKKSKKPDQKINIDLVNKNELKHRFILAELYYYGIDWIDSAESQLKIIVNELEPKSYTPNSYLLLSNIYEKKGNTDKSNEYRNLLNVKFPKSDLVFYLKKEDNDLSFIEKNKKSEELYLNAENLIFNENKVEDAISVLKDIHKNYPETEYAPKSLFTIGWIYENYLSDSLNTMNYYTKVTDDYPFSHYASEVEKRIRILTSKEGDKQGKTTGKDPNRKTTQSQTDTKADEQSGSTVPPQIISDVKAEYVDSEREKGHKGYVEITMVINRQGRPVTARVTRNTTGSKLLEESAKKAAKQCLFIPGKKNGKTTAMKIEKKFYFGVDKDEEK